MQKTARLRASQFYLLNKYNSRLYKIKKKTKTLTYIHHAVLQYIYNTVPVCFYHSVYVLSQDKNLWKQIKVHERTYWRKPLSKKRLNFVIHV